MKTHISSQHAVVSSLPHLEGVRTTMTNGVGDWRQMGVDVDRAQMQRLYRLYLNLRNSRQAYPSRIAVYVSLAESGLNIIRRVHLRAYKEMLGH